MLELACGTGRVTVPIAQAGVPIVGVDSSVRMLVRAREKAARLGDLPVRWVDADMREFDLLQPSAGHEPGHPYLRPGGSASAEPARRAATA